MVHWHTKWLFLVSIHWFDGYEPGTNVCKQYGSSYEDDHKGVKSLFIKHICECRDLIVEVFYHLHGTRISTRKLPFNHLVFFLYFFFAADLFVGFPFARPPPASLLATLPVILLKSSSLGINGTTILLNSWRNSRLFRFPVLKISSFPDSETGKDYQNDMHDNF